MPPLSCFNPRAHAGRDNNAPVFNSISEVSIHAPTRGATRLGVVVGHRVQFQSTRPRGARQNAGGDPWNVLVSIHAPTRGATPPTLATGLPTVFQSTRPRGARPMASSTSATSACFNPRAHAGRDFNPVFADFLKLVSIHAPTRGATIRLWASPLR